VLSDDFTVKVRIHQRSVLSLLLLTMVLKTLLSTFRTGLPWELLYADDLVLITDNMDEVVVKFKRWKDGIESKGLHVNVEKIKVMVSGADVAL